jgi:tetratricopeptide (TPR) repeat protein
MLHDVRYGGLAGRLGEESEMKIARHTHACGIFVLAFLAAGLVAPLAHASNIALTPEQRKALDTIYQGDPDGAIVLARAIQQAAPQQPEGYVIESEALWWKRYCGACEIKYGMIEAWAHEKRPEDEAYLALADRIVELAKAQLAKSETAEMHFFVGMGYALKVRVYGLRSESRNAARAAVNARSEMLRALELDPQLADATAAMGVYNYYVDTLSPAVKFLRFFMGIPGGNKELGVKQMEIGMNQGTVLAVHVRFILARALRQYDQKYEEALGFAEPLVARYPQNPLFLLLAGNLNAELGRNAKAAEYFRQVQNGQQSGSLCPERTRSLANSFLQTLH